MFTVDVSEFNAPVDDSYTRNWFGFRACDGDHVDNHVQHNLGWAMDTRQARKLLNFSVYAVFRPGLNDKILQHINDLQVPKNCVLEIDAEGFDGEVRNNHSQEINELWRTLVERQGGRYDLVWGYGNQGPDTLIWANKPLRMPWRVARYVSSKPQVHNLAGWQYTNGQFRISTAFKGYPRRSAPFGACDHNVLFQTPTPY